MSLDMIDKSLKSYNGVPGLIGVIGGEPLVHPEFELICLLIQKYYSPNKMYLFTSIDPWKHRLSKIIISTFGYIAYHPKDQRIFKHQPLTIAIKDVVRNEQLRKDLINDCWVQRKWCPTITNDGAFFCEVGASIAKLMNRKGWDVDHNWWRRTPDQFGDQLDICNFCGMCIPLRSQETSNKVQYISPSFLRLLQENNLPIGEYILFDKEVTIDEMRSIISTWTPGYYKEEQFSEGFVFSTLDWSRNSLLTEW
jgi:hypothetical protein